MITLRQLTGLYNRCHDLMRNVDGLQPQEALDELLKYLFFREVNEERGPTTESTTFALSPAGQLSPQDKKALRQIRELFSEYMAEANDWVQQLWPDKKIKLSDTALLAVHNAFGEANIRDIPLDIRSVALKEFLTPDLRKGLGIFLTPDAVIRAAVRIISPKANARVYDPACGSGTFLIETLRLLREQHPKKQLTVWGSDKSPRMLVLADLNLGHDAKTRFRRQLADSLFDLPRINDDDFAYDSFDVVLTNPPFGVQLEHLATNGLKFQTCLDENGLPYSRQQSEVVFVEQCLRFLKPGGVLGIVLPKSVVTNTVERIDRARKVIDALGYVWCGFSLPPETFAITGTQTTTAVVFIKKYERSTDLTRKHRIAWIDVSNVGYDTTGRSRSGSDLDGLPDEMLQLLSGTEKTQHGRLLAETSINETFARLPKLLSARTSTVVGNTRLGDLVALVRTGRTPARSAYQDNGLFVLKVGNLTGQGIDWSARERNFVSPSERGKRGALGLLVERGDIVLTSSAHSPIYIAKKVDIVTDIPPQIGGDVSLVGELMLVRVLPEKVDPYALLAFLRAPPTAEHIRRMIRGQTAHLHADDLMDLIVPDVVLEKSAEMTAVKELLQEESRLALALSDIHFRQEVLMQELFVSLD